MRNAADLEELACMSKDSLQNQADRAENIADQMVDDALKETFLGAAKEYREKAAQETKTYALFKGGTQLTGTFPSEQETLMAALAQGLVPGMQTADQSAAQRLPADYHIEQVEEPYEPQPDWKLPREIS
jgi:hypothetical protein